MRNRFPYRIAFGRSQREAGSFSKYIVSYYRPAEQDSLLSKNLHVEKDFFIKKKDSSCEESSDRRYCFHILVQHPFGLRTPEIQHFSFLPVHTFPGFGLPYTIIQHSQQPQVLRYWVVWTGAVKKGFIFVFARPIKGNTMPQPGEFILTKYIDFISCRSNLFLVLGGRFSKTLILSHSFFVTAQLEKLRSFLFRLGHVRVKQPCFSIPIFPILEETYSNVITNGDSLIFTIAICNTFVYLCLDYLASHS